MEILSHFRPESSVEDVIHEPVFKEYGRLLFPVERGYWRGDRLNNLNLTWYGKPDTKETVDVVNRLYTEAVQNQPVFLDIYSEEEKKQDPAKRDTGLFFFQGEDNARTAIVSAGGGFAYVGAMQDSFPHALELSKRGYNAFAIIYRPGWDTAMEDLGRAIAYLYDHADELHINMQGYSLWGGSAGARMAATLGNRAALAYYTKRMDIPQAAAVIMEYTGHADASRDDAPTYAICGTSDWIADWRTMRDRLAILKHYGIPTEFHTAKGLPHGFGLGIGTVAQGWINDAIVFWEKQMKNL